MESVGQYLRLSIQYLAIKLIQMAFDNLREDVKKRTANRCAFRLAGVLFQPPVPSANDQLVVGHQNALRRVIVEPTDDCGGVVTIQHSNLFDLFPIAPQLSVTGPKRKHPAR